MSEAAAMPSEHACVRLVRQVALRRALWVRSEWAQRPETEALYQAIESLGREPLAQRAHEAAFYRDDPAARDLGVAIAATAEQLQADDAWRSLSEGLTQPEEQLLALCLAAEADPGLRRLYGYLVDAGGPVLASPWLAELLFAWEPDTCIVPASRLHGTRLAAPVEGQAWSKATPWATDAALLGFLGGQLVIPVEIAAAAAFDHGASATWPVLYPGAVDEALEFLRALRSQPASAYEIEIVGADGSGRRTLASQLCARMGKGALRIEVPALRLEQQEGAAGRLALAARTAWLAGMVPVWIGAEQLPEWAWSVLAGVNPLRILVCERGAAPARAGTVRRTVRTDSLRYDQRIDLWKRLAATDPPAPVREWSLSVSDLVAAAQVAPRGAEAVAELCRSRMGHQHDDLLSPLACPFTWDDLVLHGHVEQHLREFEAQVRLRHEVYDDWGFGRQRPLGQGISALFCGPSGVGKTMAAQVIARSLGLELLRVDFASVINKYVGETEKRIRQVFRRCQRANVLLFIDECDALFAHRVQTRDAQDRFANIEVDYLLQCMEQFDGVAVLATNRKGEIDGAFLRRVRFIIDFMPPTAAERLRLWKLALPTASPAGEPLLDDVDLPALANKLNLTGAQINNVAIGAACLARAGLARIRMQHVLAAARRELAKYGTVVRPGDWEEL